jgi:hypothetical protein
MWPLYLIFILYELPESEKDIESRLLKIEAAIQEAIRLKKAA